MVGYTKVHAVSHYVEWEVKKPCFGTRIGIGFLHCHRTDVIKIPIPWMTLGIKKCIDQAIECKNLDTSDSCVILLLFQWLWRWSSGTVEAARGRTRATQQFSSRPHNAFCPGPVQTKTDRLSRSRGKRSERIKNWSYELYRFPNNERSDRILKFLLTNVYSLKYRSCCPTFPI